MVRVSKKRFDIAVHPCRFLIALNVLSAKMYLRYLESNVFPSSYTPSQADVHVHKAITAVPAEYLNVGRWYTHIKSYAAEHGSLPGSSKAGESFFGSAAAEEDDEVDLFGSDDEEADAEAERIKAERVAAYNEKKANKPKTVAKVRKFCPSNFLGTEKMLQSVVTLDVKPWDDETDMAALEAAVRSIEQDGLVWGASKLVAIGYGTTFFVCNTWF